MGMMTEQAQGRAIREQAESLQAQTNERLDTQAELLRQLVAEQRHTNELMRWLGELMQAPPDAVAGR